MAAPLDLLLVILAVSCTTANNVTVQWAYNDDCTNECDDTDNRYWCGKYRKDPEGFISRCVQYTRNGEICVNECGGNKKYNWCLTNAYKLDADNDWLGSEADWWGYCSLAGFTINKVRCWDDCDMRDEDYFWCHTSQKDKDKWDYCSPPGLVKPVHLDRHGKQCITECGRHGQHYFWCARSRNYCDEKSCDDDWEYCSLDDMHTRRGKKCKERCSMGGKSYYWCYTVDGSWDYCSPIAKDGVHVSLEIQLTRYGVKCRGACKMADSDYFWCEVIGGYSSSWWDYCSPQKKTINKAPCTDHCAQRGKNYYWCHTQDSWDYCSPENNNNFGYTSIYAGASNTYLHFVSVVLVTWCIKANLDINL